MKRHKRCSISGSESEIEIPLLLSFLHLLGRADAGVIASFLEKSSGPLRWPLRSAPRTVSGGEFDWGGTSVKE